MLNTGKGRFVIDLDMPKKFRVDGRLKQFFYVSVLNTPGTRGGPGGPLWLNLVVFGVKVKFLSNFEM